MVSLRTKQLGTIILALFCSFVIASYLSSVITRALGFSGPELAVVSFILYAVIFLLFLSGLEKALGVFILDKDRL